MLFTLAVTCGLYLLLLSFVRTKIFGMLVCAASLICFLRARHKSDELPPEDSPYNKDPEDYEALDDGPEDL